MKSLEERAHEYADNSPWDDGVFTAFIDGEKSEHEELTKWNSPDNPPCNDRQILIKVILTTDNEQNHSFYNIAIYTHGKYCYLYSESMKFDKIIGWREIHE